VSESPSNAAALAATAQALTEQVRALAGEVGGLADEVAEVDGRARRSRRVLSIAIVGLAFDLVLSCVVFFGLFAQSATDRRLESLIVRQDEIRNGALCPLYGLFLRSYNPDGPAAKADPVQYERSFVEIRRSYGVLECAGPVPTPVPR